MSPRRVRAFADSARDTNRALFAAAALHRKFPLALEPAAAGTLFAFLNGAVNDAAGECERR